MILSRRLGVAAPEPGGTAHPPAWLISEGAAPGPVSASAVLLSRSSPCVPGASP